MGPYSTAFFEQTFDLTAQTEAQFDLTAFDPNYTLSVDENGDGSADYDLIPSVSILATEHDVGVIWLSTAKTVAGQGYCFSLNVTVSNWGVFSEEFNVTLWANNTVLLSRDLFVANGSQTDVCFALNTSLLTKGNYTVTAQALPVSGETSIEDNNYSQVHSIIVSFPGDVTGISGSPDFRVDMRDIGLICRNFGANSLDPDWISDLDINNDDLVNMWDIGIACRNFGKC